MMAVLDDAREVGRRGCVMVWMEWCFRAHTVGRRQDIMHDVSFVVRSRALFAILVALFYELVGKLDVRG